jgi:hypothetical protein
MRDAQHPEEKPGNQTVARRTGKQVQEQGAQEQKQSGGSD